MKKTKIFYISFDDGSKVYEKAYDFFNLNSKKFYIERFNGNIIMMPFKAVVIIESISSIKPIFFLRPDIKIIHIPRGGASLKIGWSTLNRRKWHIALRLLRRNFIVMRNKYISRYYSLEEKTPLSRYRSGPEVIDNYLKSLKIKKRSLHISLSECWDQNNLETLIKKISNTERFSSMEISVSVHPQLKNKIEIKGVGHSEYCEKYIPEYFITDCVSTCYLSPIIGVIQLIKIENQTPDRELIFPQENIFIFNSNLNVDDDFFEINLERNPFLRTDNISFEKLLDSIVN